MDTVISQDTSISGRELMNRVLEYLIEMPSRSEIEIKKINSLEEAFATLVMGNEELREDALKFIQNEVKKGKVVWGSITPYLALFHSFCFVKEDVEVTSLMSDLLKNTLRYGRYISHTDRILIELMQKAYEYKSTIEKPLKRLDQESKKDKKTREVIYSTLLGFKNSLEKTIDVEDPIVHLIKEVLLAELRWTNPEELNEAMKECKKLMESFVSDREILENFMIIRDEVKNLSLEYFYRRADFLYKFLLDKNSSYTHYKREVENLEKIKNERIERINKSNTIRLAIALLGFANDIWLIIHTFNNWIGVIPLLVSLLFTIIPLIEKSWKSFQSFLESLLEFWYSFRISRVRSKMEEHRILYEP